MKKKIVFSISLIVILLVIILLFCFNNIKKNGFKKEVRQNIEKLSDVARSDLNSEQLFADIEALINHKDPMFAIKEGDTQYVGDGYYYKTISGGEMNTYIFYSSIDDREIYRFDVIYPLSLDS